MKKEDLKHIMYANYYGYELRIPICVDATTIILYDENKDVTYASYAVYKKINSYVYNEKMEKLFAFKLSYIVETRKEVDRK